MCKLVQITKIRPFKPVFGKIGPNLDGDCATQKDPKIPISTQKRSFFEVKTGFFKPNEVRAQTQNWSFLGTFWRVKSAILNDGN
jgi:hypothetical protein